MLTVNVLSAVILNVIMLIAIMLNVIILSPYYGLLLGPTHKYLTVLKKLVRIQHSSGY
jgi:hypothetical protein